MYLRRLACGAAFHNPTESTHMTKQHTLEVTNVTQEAERLWGAMLAIFPAIINDELKHAPEGCAQLCREHAQALMKEWARTQAPVTKWAPPG
jgi:hypothetical protein